METQEAKYDPLDRIISENEAAKIRGISPDTLRRNSERGGKPERLRLSMRRVGYRLREVLGK
jgi:predicted DNA-binding transcriptional regulator AlpA